MTSSYRPGGGRQAQNQARSRAAQAGRGGVPAPVQPAQPAPQRQQQ